ncbi:MAG: ferritin [Ignavibacteriaceae bacterium]|nr:ferritin [Ignavibacteriaceae bacterium]
MIKSSLENAINNQINTEFYSSYLYLSMSAYFEAKSFSGFAKWMVIQAQEEYTHAMKFYTYLIQKGGMVKLSQIDEPKQEWKSLIDVFEDTYEHEQKVTASINAIVDLALQEKDHATVSFLNWFVTEQVEEEATVQKIVDDLKLIGDNNNGLFMMDRELGQRATTASSVTV